MADRATAQKTKMAKNSLIRKLYLYLFSLIGLVLLVIGCVKLVNLTLKTFVFTKADQTYGYPIAEPIAPGGKTAEIVQPNPAEIEVFQNNQLVASRQRDTADSLAMLIVGLPLFLYHWHVIKKEKNDT